MPGSRRVAGRLRSSESEKSRGYRRGSQGAEETGDEIACPTARRSIFMPGYEMGFIAPTTLRRMAQATFAAIPIYWPAG